MNAFFNQILTRLTRKVTEQVTRDQIDCYFKRNALVQQLPHAERLFMACRVSGLEFLYYDELTGEIHFQTGNGIHAITDEYFWMFMEMLCDKRYVFYRDYVRGDYSLVDAGANRGYASLFFASDPNCKRVSSFEPVRRPFAFLEKHIELNRQFAGKISAFNFGLSDKPGRVTFLVHPKHDGFSGNQTFIERSLDEKRRKELVPEEVELRRASEVLKGLEATTFGPQGLERVLKLDIEGAEYEVLADLKGAGLLDGFSLIFGECHRGIAAVREIVGTHFALRHLSKEPVEGHFGFLLQNSKHPAVASTRGGG